MKGGEAMGHNYIYMRVYQQLRDRIEQGSLAPGARLETEMELCEQFQVSRETIRRALSLLETDGLITRKVSLGTFVTASKTQYAPSLHHESFTEQMRRQGKHPSSQIRSIEILTELPPQAAEALALEPGERVYRVKRVRLADGVPMAYEIAYIREKLCPNLHTFLLDDTSLYSLYEGQFHLHMGQISLKMEAVTATPQLQKILGLKNSLALMKMTSLMRLTDATPLYYVVSYHVGDQYEFTTVMTRENP